MDFSTLSDPYLKVAFWTGVAAIGMTLLLSGQIVYLRVALRRTLRREKRIIDKWRPLLNAAIVGDAPASLPPLRHGEDIVFLKLWLHLHESLRGDASAALNDIAFRLRCDVRARELLAGGNRAQRLLAVLALGHLRDISAWPALLHEASRRDGVLSIHALWALVQIDAGSAARTLMPTVLRREDWSLSQVATILQDARDSCAPALEQALPLIESAHLPRALRLAEALRIGLPEAALAGLAVQAPHEVLIAALRLASTPDWLNTVRLHAGHEDWRVRVQAAKALGRIGDRSDVARLRGMLNDAQWWVRYRAAQSLVALPFLNRADLDGLCASVTDRFAGDMLKQVLAERLST